MSNIELIEESYIGEHLICLIEYADYSAFTDSEIVDVGNWLKYYKNCTFEYGEESLFKTCEITCQFGLCVKVDIYKAIPNVQ